MSIFCEYISRCFAIETLNQKRPRLAYNRVRQIILISADLTVPEIVSLMRK